MSAQPETVRRREVYAHDKFANNSERLLWAAHVRAAQLLDDEPGLIARVILNAVDAQWRGLFLKAG